MVLVDPVSLPFAWAGKPLKQAKGLSLALYKWLEITRDKGLAPDVKKALRAEGDAALWKHQGKCEIIHLACPDYNARAATAKEANDPQLVAPARSPALSVQAIPTPSFLATSVASL